MHKDRFGGTEWGDLMGVIAAESHCCCELNESRQRTLGSASSVGSEYKTEEGVKIIATFAPIIVIFL